MIVPLRPGRHRAMLSRSSSASSTPSLGAHRSRRPDRDRHRYDTPAILQTRLIAVPEVRPSAIDARFGNARRRSPGGTSCGTTTTRPSERENLCDYGVGNGKANWATGAAIGQLEAAAIAFKRDRQAASRSATPASSMAATSPSTRPTNAASTSTSGPSASRQPVHLRARTGGCLLRSAATRRSSTSARPRRATSS